MATEPIPAPDPPAAPAPGPEVPSPRRLSPLGAVLSYLVPGLGQIAQGRLGKGVLFLLCVYTLFFYGVYLGAAEVRYGSRTFRVSSNVFIPRPPEPPPPQPPEPNATILTSARRWMVDTGAWAASYPRPQFAAQFWVGVAAWPAIVQYNHANAQPDASFLEREITELHLAADRAERDNDPDEAKKKLAEASQKSEDLKARMHPILGDFMREPGPQATNMVFNAGDKRLDLAWVFTVIAGVLNIMVIYDALAGPAFASPEDARKKAG